MALFHDPFWRASMTVRLDMNGMIERNGSTEKNWNSMHGKGSDKKNISCSARGNHPLTPFLHYTFLPPSFILTLSA